MNKLLNRLELIRPALRYSLLILVAISILKDNKTCFVNYIIILSAAVFLIIYTYICLGASTFPKHDISFIIISIVVSTFILNTVRNNTFIFIYYFIIMDDIFNNTNDCKTRYELVTIHFVGSFIRVFTHTLTIQNNSLNQNLQTIFWYIFIYILILAIYISVHINKDERNKLKVLNSKLIEYSFKERDYLISEERSRISQELHDSLGHILMALSMNVRYIKAVKDKKEIDTELDEIEALVQESINTLRKTVYNLKKLENNFNLYEEIKAITSKFNSLNMVKINLDYDDEIEKIPNQIKSALLTTIKEGITNSIKHGNASEINISITLNAGDICFIIDDNGTGCKNINKSNGLNGITNRFHKINGEVNFWSIENKGFTIEAVIHGGSFT